MLQATSVLQAYADSQDVSVKVEYLLYAFVLFALWAGFDKWLHDARANRNKKKQDKDKQKP